MDDAEARAILREHGHDPPAKGKLAPHWREEAESYRGGATGQDDYDDPDLEAAFGTEPESVTEAAPPPPLEEQRPRKVKAKATRPTLRDRMRGGAKPKQAKRKHPRVSVAPLISEAWGLLGGLAVQVDRPLGVCLQMEAPVAGVVLEDVVKGTAADRALQPLARMEDKAKKVGALVLPPLCVAGLEMAQRYPEPQRKAREALLWPMLVQSLMLSEQVAGQYAEQIIEQAQQSGPARERAEAMARVIFGEPEPAPAEAETVPA